MHCRLAVFAHCKHESKYTPFRIKTILTKFGCVLMSYVTRERAHDCRLIYHGFSIIKQSQSSRDSVNLFIYFNFYLTASAKPKLKRENSTSPKTSIFSLRLLISSCRWISIAGHLQRESGHQFLGNLELGQRCANDTSERLSQLNLI